VRDRLLAPKIVTVSFALEPVYNVLESMSDLTEVNRLSGFSDWIVQAAMNLPPERKRVNRLLFGACEPYFMALPLDQNWTSFPAFLDHLAAYDAVKLRDSMLAHLCKPTQEVADGVTPPAPAQLLGSLEAYIAWHQAVLQEHGHSETDVELLAWSHRLLNDPPALLNTTVTHLRVMWHEVLAEEWVHNLPMLEESVAAFNKVDFSGLTALEAIRAVTGRDLRGKWADSLNPVEHIVFVPSPHIGPYVSKFMGDKVIRLIFGARLPKGIKIDQSAVSRSELLVRINGLADDARLRILDLLRQEGEMCAQDIIARLGMSQSSVSRHLSQLSATGYLTERRRDVAKCYSLNTDRIEETLRALSSFLLPP